MKWLALNSEGKLLTATLNGDVALDDGDNTDDPWTEGLGKKSLWDEEE